MLGSLITKYGGVNSGLYSQRQVCYGVHMSIQLTVRFYGPRTEQQLQSYDLRVVVTNAVDMSKKVFVWQANVPSNTDAEAAAQPDQFINVASPVDLEKYPEDAPDLQRAVPYYRTDEVVLRFRCMADLQEVKDLIDADLGQLVVALQLAADMAVMEEKTYG